MRISAEFDVDDEDVDENDESGLTEDAFLRFTLALTGAGADDISIRKDNG